MKKRIVFAIIPLVVIPLVIGGGFAIFIFGKGSVSENQAVNIEIENAKDIGELKLVYKDGDNYLDELARTDLTNTVVLGYQNAMLVNSDNPTKGRSFILEYDHPTASEYTGNTLGLYCSFEVSDTDARGVNILTASDGKLYSQSNSVVDIYQPSRISYQQDGSTSITQANFSVKEELTTSKTYVCKIMDITPTLNGGTFYYDLNLALTFATYNVTYSGSDQKGTFAPIASYSYDSHIAKFKANQAACQNATVNIKFYLE